MINVYRYDTLGRANFGWLDAHYHFSFADYHNPDRIHFGALRVINDDIVQPGEGFGMHPHRDMEIITFVRKGAISHIDSQGHEGRTVAGDVQVMSAGRGILHSEFNHEETETNLYQIWIFPREKGIAPRWESARFADRKADGVLPLLVSGRADDAGKGALYIHQDASISGGQMAAGTTITQPIHGQAYLLVSAGSIDILGQTLYKGDGAEIAKEATVKIKALDDSEVILIDVPD